MDLNEKSEKWQKIKQLDLKTVVEKLRKRKGFIWRWRNDLKKLEREYRQFLYLILSNPEKTIVPWSQPLDDLWHEHILDTQKYKEDCESVFGKFIHHNPHVPKGTRKHTTASRDTNRMRSNTFHHDSIESPNLSYVFDTVLESSNDYHHSHGDHSHSYDHGSSHSYDHSGGDHSHSDHSASCGSHGDSGASSCGSSCSSGSSCGSSCGGGGD